MGTQESSDNGEKPHNGRANPRVVVNQFLPAGSQIMISMNSGPILQVRASHVTESCAEWTE